MKLRILASFLLFSSLIFSQEASENPVFEVASIKPAQPMIMNRIQVRMNTDGGTLRYTNVSLKDCIRTAYRVKDYQVQGPDWLGSTRFDIQAKFPPGATESQVPEMLKALLADRFKLTVHRDEKEHAIYALVVAKSGPKLKPAEIKTDGDTPSSGRGGGGAGGRGGMMMEISGAGAHLKALSVTLSSLAENLSRFTEFPVVDMTGIKGQYDFDLVFSPESMRGTRMGAPMPPPGEGGGGTPDGSPEKAGSVYDSVQPYGLKLESRKAPMETIFVDHIEKAPSEN